MPNIQSTFGKVSVFEDFQGYGATASIADATGGTRYNELCIVALSGAVDFINTVDESGGVASFSGAGGAADGVSIFGAPAVPTSNGTMVIEARFKGASATDLRAFVGWQETVDLAETVNPFTLSGTTLTANNGGEVVGFYTDTAATTDDFRFMASAAGTADTGAAVRCGPLVAGLNSNATTLGSLGIRAGCTITADSWYIARVEVGPDGRARGYFGHTTMGNRNGLTLVAELQPGTLSTTALYYPIVILAARLTGDPLLEIENLGYTYNRDWAA